MLENAKAHGVTASPVSIGPFANRNIGAVDPITEELGRKGKRDARSSHFSAKWSAKCHSDDTKVVSFAVQTSKLVAKGGLESDLGNASILVEDAGEIGWSFVRDAIEDHINAVAVQSKIEVSGCSLHVQTE